GLLELALDLLGDRAHVSVRAARGDHHVVADGRFPPDVDRYHFLGLGIVEPSQDVGEEGFRVVRGHEFGGRRAPASTLKCSRHIVLAVLSSSNPIWRAGSTPLAKPHFAEIRLEKHSPSPLFLSRAVTPYLSSAAGRALAGSGSGLRQGRSAAACAFLATPSGRRR